MIYRASLSRSAAATALSNGIIKPRLTKRSLKPAPENTNPAVPPTPDQPLLIEMSPRKGAESNVGNRRPVPPRTVPKAIPKLAEEVAPPKPEPLPAYNLINQVGVQMLSSKLHSQVFPGKPFAPPSRTATRVSQNHLKTHQLNTELASRLPETTFDLPPLRGGSIDEHFYNIGSHMAMPWLKLATDFASGTEKKLPPKPEQFAHYPGWTRYDVDGSFQPVQDLGSESAICFDVETLPAYSHYPVMACAVSETAWYVWISPWLLGLDPSPEHLIPIGDPTHPRVIVGHNVSYDRARILEEYTMEGTKNRFLDTMSLHIACKGITSGQRPTWLSYRKQKRVKYEQQRESIETIDELLAELESQPELDQERYDELVALKADLEDSLPALIDGADYFMNEDTDEKRWEEVTSINSLADVARLYCGVDLDKSTRDDFMTSTREQIADRIDEYLAYCCNDVATTLSVYQIVLPAFLGSCPSPVSFAGVLTMGSAFLTVDQEWENYLRSAEQKYHELEGGVRETLLDLAKEALAMYENDTEGLRPWEADEWLSQLDWTPKKVGKSRGIEPPEQPPPKILPKWYADITKERPGPTIQGRIIPLLLDMKWKPGASKSAKTYPLFFSSEHGWLAGCPHGKRLFKSPLRVDIGDHDELAPLRDRFHFHPLQPGVTVRNILTRKSGGNWVEEDLLVCETNELAQMALRFCTGTAPDSDWEALRSIASDILAKGPPSERQVDTPTSILQLNWKGIQVGKRPPRDPAGDVYWPKWYWDLTAPKPDTDRGTANLTVRSQIAPLLLRLRWMDYPLFHSRTHGWMYRVPKQDLEKIGTASKALEFYDEVDEKLKKMCAGGQFYFFKLPHKDGDQANVGSPMSKTFLKYSQDGTLSSPGDAAKSALNMNAQCSYWISARDRVLKQVVMWDQRAKVNMGLPPPPPPPSLQLTPPPSSSAETPEPGASPATPRKYGMILPQVITMGTVTRRAIEKTWLTASNAKPNRIGSELKTLVRAPGGYAIVGADVDSEELWIASVIGDAQFGIHGATAIGWMTLEGTKAAGTDLHSKTASILGISRNQAKVFNYSRIYGAGINHAVLLLLQHSASMNPDTAKALAKNLYASTKGKSTYSTTMFGRKFWYGGTESYLFNKLEQIATSDDPRTPTLGCGVTSALSKRYLPGSGDDYMTSRINWVVQSSGVDYLHMLIVAVDYLIKAYHIEARYLISIHDEVRYLAKKEDKYRLALALQIANLWTRCMFAYKLGLDNLPQGVAFFSAVDVDKYLRKEVDMTCITPSQPIPLPPGESLDIYQILEKTSGGSLCADGASSSAESKVELTAPRAQYVAPDVLAHREACGEFLEAQSLHDTYEIRMLAQVVRSREREREAELEARANIRPKSATQRTRRVLGHGLDNPPGRFI